MFMFCFFIVKVLSTTSTLFQGQGINKKYYIKVLCRLKDAAKRKRPQLWASVDWQLHHDNVAAHSSRLEQGFCQNFASPSSVPPPQLRFGSLRLRLLTFSKVKIAVERWEISDGLRRTRRWRSRKRPSQTVLKSGRDAGTSVWGCKWSTLKWIKAPLS